MFLPYVITNTIAVVTVATAIFWPTVARRVLGIIFIGAFGFNLFLVVENPSAYLDFAIYTRNSLYRSFILGFFQDHIRWCVSAIAVCQLMIGIFLFYKGQLMRFAIAGGVFFLFAISPLGKGSAFPAPLMMALALLVLLFKRISFSVYDVFFNGKDRSAELHRHFKE